MATHQQPVDVRTPIDDHDAIAATVQMYIDGSAQGDAAKLTDAFHPNAQMYGAVGPDRYDEPIAEYVKLMAESRGDRRGGRLLGDAVLHDVPHAVAHRRALAHRQQELRPHGRGDAGHRVTA